MAQEESPVRLAMAGHGADGPPVCLLAGGGRARPEHPGQPDAQQCVRVHTLQPREAGSGEPAGGLALVERQGLVRTWRGSDPNKQRELCAVNVVCPSHAGASPLQYPFDPAPPSNTNDAWGWHRLRHLQSPSDLAPPSERQRRLGVAQASPLQYPSDLAPPSERQRRLGVAQASPLQYPSDLAPPSERQRRLGVAQASPLQCTSDLAPPSERQRRLGVAQASPLQCTSDLAPPRRRMDGGH